MNSQRIISHKALFARTAMAFIHETEKYKSEIYIKKEDRIANAKSLLGLLSLGIQINEEIEIMTDGKDEDLALDKIVRFLIREDCQ